MPTDDVWTEVGNKRVRVSVRRTVNLGDFNSISLEMGLEEDVPEGVLASQHLSKMADNVSKLVQKELIDAGVVKEL